MASTSRFITSLKLAVVLFVLALVGLTLSGRGPVGRKVDASAFGPSPSHTNAPNEGNCTACHSDFPVNSGTGGITIDGVPAVYTPGEQVSLTITLSQSDAVLYGFQVTALLDDGSAAGTFTLPNQNPQQIQSLAGLVGPNVRTYVEHTIDGIIPTEFGSKSWTFTWNAPPTDVGRVTFYAAGNAANSDGDLTGDYIYTTSRETNTALASAVPFDFDGDGKTDVSIFRPNPSSVLGNAAPEGSSSQWWIFNSGSQSPLGITFGQSDDMLVPADYTGDGKADVAFFRPSNSTWYVLRSEDFTFFAFPFGGTGDIPAPGDFDGDGKADPAVYRPSSGTWFILRSSDGGVSAVPFGIAEDKPVVADYDGDGMDDVAVYRPSVNQWWLLRSTAGVLGVQFGAAGDRTAIGDWTGDGKADIAFYRPSTSEYYVIRSEDSSFFAFPWGASGDISAVGDYDGDGVTDAAVYRPSIGTWFINGSTSGFLSVPFGLNGDTPVPSSVSVQ